MNLASFLANKCFEFLLTCEGEKGRGHGFPAGRQSGKSISSQRLFSPPWAIAEQEFRSACDGCGACLERCANGILIAGVGGCPVVDFSRGSCSFCGACAEGCPREAFAPVQSRPTWDIKARITDHCLGRNNVLCRTCAEHCPEDAIIFPKQAGTISGPLVLADKCSGCGACFSPCPTGAIAMKEGDEIHTPGGNR
jgi:ferredoxin-type protein NapF